MSAAVNPEKTYEWYLQQIDLLESAGRTGAPTRDPRSVKFFGLPFDDFTAALREFSRAQEASDSDFAILLSSLPLGDRGIAVTSAPGYVDVPPRLWDD